MSKKLVYGVGINDADYPVMPKVNGKYKTCPIYRAWNHMLERCYSDNYHIKFPTYKNCTVDPRWHKFSVFREWMITQNWQNNQLDKDILVLGNRIYSPETCCFVHYSINGLLHENKLQRSELPIGVFYSGSRYRAMLNIRNKIKHIGMFDTETEAHRAYCCAKSAEIKRKAKEVPELHIKQALHRIADGMLPL